jgi:probable F420-dependent oxidoreductase
MPPFRLILEVGRIFGKNTKVTKSKGVDMKFGIMFANTLVWAGPKALEMATVAEECGADSLWTVEHVILPENFQSKYPYSKDGRMPGGDEAAIPDPLIWLSYVAGVTSNIKLCTGILIAPQRNPLMLAKEVATLDVLSNHRVVLGVGVGWLKEEFEALGADFKTRAKRLDETIEALRVLWTENPASYKGEVISFEKIKCNPKPVKTPPIVIGGHSEAAAKRAGKLGDGFFHAITDAKEIEKLIGIMKKAAIEAGRDPDSIEITCSGAFDVESIKRMRDLGVSRCLTLPFAADSSQLRDLLNKYRDQIEAVS